MNMKRIIVVWSMLLMLALTLLAGCASSSGSSQNSALSADNINLIFVVSPDLRNDPLGDIQPYTANLTSKGLNRSLQMATFLKQQVLGGNNVTAIYALAPMTHLQTTNNYPDMTAIGFIQQFALLNQIVTPTSTYTGNSYRLFVQYGGEEDVPDGVDKPSSYIPGAQGLAFDDLHDYNIGLVNRIIEAKQPGFYVFSAPWKTTGDLLAKINTRYGNKLNLPTTYMGSNYVYAISISIPLPGSPSLVTYNSKLNPPARYPELPPLIGSASCGQQGNISYTLNDGDNGVIVPANHNTYQRVYIVRHADAHPDPESEFEDGNYVGAGQWRALALRKFLPDALKGQRRPTVVYSIDPAQSFSLSENFSVSYVRPSLTILPYAIANNLPFYLAASFPIGIDPTNSDVARNTSNFFFTHTDSDGVDLSGQTILLAWESGHIRPFLNALMASYSDNPPVLPTAATAELEKGGWPHTDYDTIWTVILDGDGNLTVHNALCEGIDSASLPATAPQF